MTLEQTLDVLTNCILLLILRLYPGLFYGKLLEFATKKSHFLFDGKYYDQIDGVAMGSPLGPVLANVFVCDFEEK